MEQLTQSHETRLLSLEEAERDTNAQVSALSTTVTAMQKQLDETRRELGGKLDAVMDRLEAIARESRTRDDRIESLEEEAESRKKRNRRVFTVVSAILLPILGWAGPRFVEWLFAIPPH
jgi:predicted  nucleic acid-binding Zn-ribbon protein